MNNEYLEHKCCINSNKNISDKHLKGYIYDSLVYRYINARRQQMVYEITTFNENAEIAKKTADRDILKFCQILNETIGEHD